ncbi:hypothetical protein [Bradyrhizobium sp. RDT46]|uniref:hypothetical protein n=1 Tax=Bradyrhizobium sp. RDT46 TaxID=3341829 RepID=UPI0035C6AF1E
MSTAPFARLTRCHGPIQANGAGNHWTVIAENPGEMDEVGQDLDDRMRSVGFHCDARSRAKRAPTAKPGGTVQSKPMQGSTMGSGDEEMNAQPGAAGEKTGMKPTKSTRGTAGTTGSATHKGTADDAATGAAPSKRY